MASHAHNSSNNCTRHNIYLYDDEEDSSDEERAEMIKKATPQQLEVKTVIDRMIKHLKGVPKDKWPKTRKQLTTILHPHCKVSRYQKIPDIMEVLKKMNVLNVSSEWKVTYNDDAILSWRQESWREGLSKQQQSYYFALDEDLKLVVERILFCLKGNEKLPANYFELAHLLTTFCEVSHTVNLKDVFDELQTDEYIEFMGQDNEEDDYPITFAKNTYAHVDWKKQDSKSTACVWFAVGLSSVAIVMVARAALVWVG